MVRLKFALKILIGIIPFYLTGKILYLVFPQIPHWTVILVFLFMFIGFLYFFYKKKKELRESNEKYVLPEYLLPSTLLYLLFGAFLADTFTIADSRTEFIIDNGKPTTIELVIDGDDKIIIPPFDFKRTSIRIGLSKISLNGLQKEINLPKKGKWILNIDSVNTYYETTVDYSNQLFKNGVIDSNLLDKPDVTFVKGELINTDASYLFEAPESITIKKDYQNKKSVSVKILYRMPK